ncbi:MAG: hypothetical protein F6K55_28005 [Moorea sp. SIO4A3]|nr:hypothetical protein [Moorena sp. SIO4A3]
MANPMIVEALSDGVCDREAWPTANRIISRRTIQPVSLHICDSSKLA